MGLVFFNFQLISLTKVLKEGNLFVKKVPSSLNSALVDDMNTPKIFIKSCYVHMIFNYLGHSGFSRVWLNNFIEANAVA